MSKLKRLLGLQFLGAALAIGLGLWLVRAYPVLPWLAHAQACVAGLGWRGALCYPLIFAACNVLLLPAGTLALGSGLFFGLGWGFALNVAGNVAGAAFAIGFSRRFGRGWIRARFLRRRKWAALDEAVAREGWKIIFLSQVLPFAPSSLLNYLFGVTKVPFRTALLWSALGQMPTMLLYAYLGTFAQFGLGVLRGGPLPPVLDFLAWGGGLAVTVAATTGLTRLTLRLLAEAERKAGPIPASESTSPQVKPPTSRSESGVLTR
jgi:uncharacterized membrane protein YdjX (TVP38/TMEM64 family)